MASSQHESKSSNPLLAAPSIGFADCPDDARAQVCLPIDEIQYFSGVMPHDQPIDGEVAPLHIFFWRACILHAIRMPPVGIAKVRSERCHFNLHSFAHD